MSINPFAAAQKNENVLDAQSSTDCINNKKLHMYKHLDALFNCPNS